MILNSELKPGSKINEQALCERFGVSRTPLREALKVLASAGLVILAPHRGARVAQITAEEVDQLFPIMGALEALAGELACRRITQPQVDHIRQLHDQMVRHYEKNEAAPYLKLNREIHEAIFEAAGNAELTQLYHNIMIRTYAVRFTARKSPTRWEEAVEDHHEIMEALETRNEQRIGELLKTHLRHKANMVYESLNLGRTNAAE
jgi:DNA-binding GntR family transcriptional regulator